MLLQFFKQINDQHFDGFLDPPAMKWNPRLRSSAGRFVPVRRYSGEVPTIEVASYLQAEASAETLILDTIAHEMIHYWLWFRGKPHGHTPEFWEKMTAMGVSRYNSVPRVRPHKYLYRCPGCAEEFRTRRKLGVLACAKCCKRLGNGRFDPRFKLVLEAHL